MTEGEIGELKAAFEQADKDKSGCLSVEELQAVMASYPELLSLMDEVMKGVDVDSSKSLNYNEFLSATMSRNEFIKCVRLRSMSTPTPTPFLTPNPNGPNCKLLLYTHNDPTRTHVPHGPRPGRTHTELPPPFSGLELSQKGEYQKGFRVF